MTTLFCVRPATRNIGNDIINTATARLLLETFGQQTALVNVPALAGPQYGGLNARQIYDMNRLADGVVIGGGNLFENGQITIDLQALEALEVPIMIIGVSHGRIRVFGTSQIDRSDAISKIALGALVHKSSVCHVRDGASIKLLHGLGADKAALGGCPTLFLPSNGSQVSCNGRVLLSLRHPDRMSVPAVMQWRIPYDVGRIIKTLEDMYGADNLRIICHDYKDIEFARGYPHVQMMYFDSPDLYMHELRHCRLNVTYRLHAFLPCFAFGVPSIHMSYDERGKSMMDTIGMGDWNIDLFEVGDPVDELVARCSAIEKYAARRLTASARVETMRQTTQDGLHTFRDLVRDHTQRTL